MKTCSLCHISKEETDFSPNSRSKDSLQSHCKKCHLILGKNWRDKNRVIFREKVKIKMREYRRLFPEKMKMLSKRSREKNKDSYALKQKNRNDLKISMVYEKYGGKCVCCGETNRKFLTLDHINNDGNIHRRTIGSVWIINWCIKNDCPKNLQLLCFNCNFGKQRNGGVCPHKAESIN